MTRSSAAWWRSVRDEPTRLHAWLFDQYRGEVTVARRIEMLRATLAALVATASAHELGRVALGLAP